MTTPHSSSRASRRLLASLLVVAGLALGLGGVDARPAAAASGTSEDAVIRLYSAVFDREPDAAGLAYWSDQLASCQPYGAIASAFMGSGEWITTYGRIDDQQFVTTLYRNVLDREPDAGGAAYWVARARDGMSRTKLLAHFAESPEHVAATGTRPGGIPECRPTAPADIIRDVWNENGAGWAAESAVRVAWCESTHRPWVASPGGGNWGLFQINTVHRGMVAAMGYSWSQITDPWVNSRVAFALWAEQGWGPWSCRWAA
ncbi:MAG TPA: DUF4214 domain-containing protein [Acidimicrobiales bacterium]|nr:DUF4214 domain-containing protein [Acidimicrobiales bacterium]